VAIAPQDNVERGGITHRSKGQFKIWPCDHCLIFLRQRLLINSQKTHQDFLCVERLVVWQRLPAPFFIHNSERLSALLDR
jgi:hypothetical protein